MENGIYPYFLPDPQPGAVMPFNRLVQFRFEADCLNRPEKLTYLYNLGRFGDFLYITDFFPAMWRDEADCFKRLTSLEGYQINIRKTVKTCFVIFRMEIFAKEPQACMVLSGSYAYNETIPAKGGMSRKLLIYRSLLSGVAREHGFRYVEIPELNAVIIVHRQSGPADQAVISAYRSFKTPESNGT